MSDLRNQVEKVEKESTAPEGYAALRERAALVRHDRRALLGLSGKRPSGPSELLAAIMTNDLPSRDDLGVYGLLLDAKGRIQTDLRILKRPGGGLVAEAEPEGAPAAREILGRYAPFSRVELEELSERESEPWSVLGLYGPAAKEKLASLLGEIPELSEHQTAETAPPGSGGSLPPLLVAGVARPVAGYDLIGPRESLDEARRSLLAADATLVPVAAYEAARIEAGFPRFGSELTPDNFPGEAGILERAVSFAKGCYPGQETVARMHYRGHPNRALYRLSVEPGSSEPGSPEPGTPIIQDGAEVGRLTSLSPVGDLALGYLHRKADLDSPLHAAGSRLHPLTDNESR